MELKNWYLRQYGEAVVAVGNVYNNDRFPDGMNITTSRIVPLNVNLQDKCLEIITYSGSHYKAVFLAKKKKQEFAKALDKELLNGDFYIELSEAAINKACFKYDDKVYKIRCCCHVGMFTDSYLYRISGVVDFHHYEFAFNGFSTYHISDTIKRLVVKNTHILPMQIDNVIYPAGQTTITCVTEENRQEGLLSPDCVNGKSLFSEWE